jgi:hypothetical protein
MRHLPSHRYLQSSWDLSRLSTICPNFWRFCGLAAASPTVINSESRGFACRNQQHAGKPPSSRSDLLISGSRLSVRTGPAGLPSRSEPRSVLRARPWSYKVGCAVWLPDWLPVPRSFLLIRRSGQGVCRRSPPSVGRVDCRPRSGWNRSRTSGLLSSLLSQPGIQLRWRLVPDDHSLRFITLLSGVVCQELRAHVAVG